MQANDCASDVNTTSSAVSSQQSLESVGSSAVPPDSNTGVLSAFIDYLAVSFKSANSLDSVLSLFGSDGWVSLEHGALGYKSGLLRGNVTVLYDGQPGMGVHVRASGQGCRDLEQRGVVADWVAFCQRLLESGGEATRVDLAHDDDTGVLDLSRIREAVQAGRVTSRYQKAKSYQEYSLKDGENVGDTVYFGSRNSETIVRFYDKAKQMGTSEQFVRCEVEFKGKTAHSVLRVIAAKRSVGALLAGVLSSKIQFRDAGSASQRCRWPVAAWWSSFLGSVSLFRLSSKPVAASLEKLAAWIDRQVGPSLAVLYYVNSQLQHDPAWFKDLIARSWGRLQKRHSILIQGALPGRGSLPLLR